MPYGDGRFTGVQAEQQLGRSGIRIATEFIIGQKPQGTVADPFPGSAIQAAFDDLPTTGGMVFIPAGTWNITTTPVLASSDVVISGAGNATKLTTTSDIPLLRLGDGTARYYRVTLEKIRLEQNSPTDTPALRISGLSQSLLNDIRILSDAEAVRHTGILWDTVGDNLSLDNKISHVVSGGTKIGIDLVGLSTARLNDMKIFGTTVNGAVALPAGSVGLRHDEGDSLRVYGLNIEAFDVGVDLLAASSLGSYYGLRLEALNTGIRMAGFNTARHHFIGGSQFAVTTFFVPNGAYQPRFRDFDLFVSERDSLATIANGTSSIVVTHSLSATPVRIFVTGTHAEVQNLWVTGITSTQFTINTDANVTADRAVYWVAKSLYVTNI